MILKQDSIPAAFKKDMAEMVASSKFVTLSIFIYQFQVVPDSIAIGNVDGTKIALWAWPRCSPFDVFSFENVSYRGNLQEPAFDFASINIGRSILLEVYASRCIVYFHSRQRDEVLKLLQEIELPNFIVE